MGLERLPDEVLQVLKKYGIEFADVADITRVNKCPNNEQGFRPKACHCLVCDTIWIPIWKP